MSKSIFLSLVFHSFMIVLTAISLPFMMREPIDLPPILREVRNVEIPGPTQHLLNGKYHDFLAFFAQNSIKLRNF